MLLWGGQLVSWIGTEISGLAFFFINIPLQLERATPKKALHKEAYEVTTSTYTVSVVPDFIRGRVTSLTRLVVLGAYSLGFFVTGILLQYFVSTWTIIIFSCLLLLLALMTVLNKTLAN